MKKFLTMSLLLILVCSLFGCAQKQNNKDLLAEIKDRGYVTIATEGAWSPWTYHDPETEELVGFDVELGKLIAKGLGVEARFEEVVWDSILSGVSAQSKRFDLGINGVDWTAERAEAYNFSDPYVYTSSVLIVPEANTDIKSFEDLAGHTTTNSIGSVYQTMAESYGATVITGDTFADTINLITRGDADATINALETYSDYIKEKPDAPIKVVAQSAGNPICIIAAKDDSTVSLISEINKILADLRASGELSALSVKYFGLDITEQK